ncbi:metallophosphoesterase family protein [Paenibacillus humicola]|uniref:metallophosphoesterase family protein n=1 Tax=Paenibacillus humicola TaxID=3110540 RepID=UPI00237BA3F6|nr:YfcE family phosphodiesterase [Paenibacillus humicola]
MKIVVVSDTHMPRMAKKLPDRLVRDLRDADAILHAGDWTQLAVWEALSAYAPTDGVAGNNDGDRITAKFGHRKILTFGGVRIGIVHGHIGGGRASTETNAFAAFAGERVDAVIFGHSHIPVMKERDGILMFNPGSPTDKRRQKHYSFGIFRIDDGRLRAEHILYTDKK